MGVQPAGHERAVCRRQDLYLPAQVGRTFTAHYELYIREVSGFRGYGKHDSAGIPPFTTTLRLAAAFGFYTVVWFGQDAVSDNKCR